jgi:hypothetical protein
MRMADEPGRAVRYLKFRSSLWLSDIAIHVFKLFHLM